MSTQPVLFPVLLAADTDPLMRAVAAYLAQFKDATRVHTESDLRAYALVLTGFAVSVAATEHAFSGSAAIVGEFGWLAAIASLVLGLAATWWHLSKPAPS